MGNTHHLDHFVSRSRKQLLIVEELCVCVQLELESGNQWSHKMLALETKVAYLPISCQWALCAQKPVQSLIKLDLWEYKRTTVGLFKAAVHRWRKGGAAVQQHKCKHAYANTPRKILGSEHQLWHRDVLVIKGCDKLQTSVGVRRRLNIVDISHVKIMFLKYEVI